MCKTCGEKVAVVNALFISFRVFIDGVGCINFHPTPLEIVHAKRTSNLVSDYNPASFLNISALSVFSHEKESSDLPK